VFDQLTNKEIFESFMAGFEKEALVNIYAQKPQFNTVFCRKDLQEQMSLMVDSIMKASFKQMSSDNISIILICFENFKKLHLMSNKDLAKKAQGLKKLKNTNIVNYVFKQN